MIVKKVKTNSKKTTSPILDSVYHTNQLLEKTNKTYQN